MDSMELLFFVILVHTSCLRSFVGGQSECTPCGCACGVEYPLGSAVNLNCSGRGITDVTDCVPPLSQNRFNSLDFSNNNLTGTLNLSTIRGNIRHQDEYCRLNFNRNGINVFRYESSSSADCDELFLLDLSKNLFTVLSSRTFIFRLEFMLLETNQISLSFQSNKIEFVHDNFLENVTASKGKLGDLTIDLSNNRIISINAVIRPGPGFRTVKKFVLLLNDNNITSRRFVEIIGNVSGPSVYSLIVISLRNNVIQGLRNIDADRIPADVSLDLSGNPWNCNCTQRFVSYNTSDFRTTLSKPTSVEPTCKEPSSVSQRPLLSLSREDFICSPTVDSEAELELMVDPGEDLELRCPFVQGDPPINNVHWQYERHIAEGMAQISTYEVNTCSNCSLIIRNIQEDGQGKYRCTVTNGIGIPLTITQTVRLSEMSHTTEKPEPDITHGEPRERTIGLIITSVLLCLVFVTLLVAVCKFWELRKRYGRDMERSTSLSVTYRNDTQNVVEAENVTTRVNDEYNEDQESYEDVEDPSKDKAKLKSTGRHSIHVYANDWRVNNRK